MKAFVYEQYGSPDILKMKEVERPAPKKDELLVRIKGISLNPADWRRLRGDPFVVRIQTGWLRPKATILGSDIAGEVIDVGEEVTQFQPGDEVFAEIGTGGFAEYVCAAEEKFALRPQNISFAEAAAAPLVGNTALQALRDFGEVESGQTVLINGASGGVGSFAIQIAKHFGAVVTAVCSKKNFDLVRSLGADDVIDYTSNDFVEVDRRFDLILDIVGNREARAYQAILAPDGKCALIGFSTFRHLTKFRRQGRRLSNMGNQKIGAMIARIDQDDLAVVAGLLDSGEVKPVIDRQLQFEDIPEGLKYLETGRARGKVIVALD